MAGTIQVDIVSAEGEIYSGQAQMVYLPAAEGEIGVAPRHAPLLALLKAGEVRVQLPEGGAELSFYVGGGALEVQPTRVTVLADTAARAHDLDEAAALAARAARRGGAGRQGRPDRAGGGAGRADTRRRATQADPETAQASGLVAMRGAVPGRRRRRAHSGSRPLC